MRGRYGAIIPPGGVGAQPGAKSAHAGNDYCQVRSHLPPFHEGDAHFLSALTDFLHRPPCSAFDPSTVLTLPVRPLARPQHFVDTGQRPQNFLRDSTDADERYRGAERMSEYGGLDHYPPEGKGCRDVGPSGHYLLCK